MYRSNCNLGNLFKGSIKSYYVNSNNYIYMLLALKYFDIIYMQLNIRI